MTDMLRIVPQRTLAWLCHLANSGTPTREFYELKDRMLREFAEFRGHDIQEITRECWGDQRDEHGDWHGCGPKCRRCGGTGIFSQRWVRLQRWHWGRYVFHIPDGSTSIKPDSVQIVGRIEHRDYGKASREAELWLFVATLQLRTLWHVLGESWYCKPDWWPMCRLQSIVGPWRMFLRRKRCWCGKWFWTWGSGWQICRKCRRPKTAKELEDIPF